MAKRSSTGSRHSNVVRAHELPGTIVGAWIPEFSGTQLRFCDPKDPGTCTPWVELKGDTGLAGATEVTAIAGEAIGLGAPVYKQADDKFYECSSEDPATREIIGLAAAAASLGDSVTAIATGLFTLGGWSWTVGQPVYVGLNGNLTQTPPIDGYLAVIGHAVAAATILLHIEPSILIVNDSAEDFRPIGVAANGELRAENRPTRVFIQEAEPPNVAGYWVKLDALGNAVDLLFNAGP